MCNKLQHTVNNCNGKWCNLTHIHSSAYPSYPKAGVNVRLTDANAQRESNTFNPDACCLRQRVNNNCFFQPIEHKAIAMHNVIDSMSMNPPSNTVTLQ